MSKETLQSVFDKVATHLLSQNEKSEHDGECLYRDEKGNKCAVGCLIPDNLYSPEIEGAGVLDGHIAGILSKSIVGYDTVVEDLLFHLQDLHDCADPHEWKDGLRNIAIHFGLEFK
jgi:hypothetical protein